MSDMSNIVNYARNVDNSHGVQGGPTGGQGGPWMAGWGIPGWVGGGTLVGVPVPLRYPSVGVPWPYTVRVHHDPTTPGSGRWYPGAVQHPVPTVRPR